ncbi:MAG: fibrobacter succinogenes major paralogous domain-containing protein [Fibrobacter sp.]|nr:fibrobacter succinogenes major paralogous domain-containing protein [Fibrobacter sp.]
MMLLASLFITAHLAACSSGGGVAAPGQASYATLEQLAQSPCNALNIGATAIVESENAIYACVGDVSTGVYGWEYSGEANQPPVENPVNENPVNNPVNENPVSQNPVLSSASAPYYPEFELSPTPSSSSVALTPGSQFNPNIVYGSMTDSRDGKTYRTVVIGSQAWMAQNLNYETTGSMCYGNLEENCAMYGRLYTWPAAMDSAGTWSTNGKGCGYGSACSVAFAGSATLVRGVCPEGWHLPTQTEWETLFTAVGGQSTAGQKLKAASGWTAYSGIINEDAFGFSALPAGDDLLGYYHGEGNKAHFWSSTEYNSRDAYYMRLYCGNDYAYLEDHDSKHNGFSVRCLKD